MHHRYGRLISTWTVGVLIITVGCMAQGPPKVIIVGGADETGHNYQWQVTNKYSSRIVRIDFPQFGANMFTTPDAWKQGTQQEMNLVGEKWNGNPGVCWAVPDGSYPGLATGQTAVFRMQIFSRGALRETGTVLVTFADGTTCSVGGVELPKQGVSMGRDAALIGTAIIFVGFIVIREYRRRRRGGTPAVKDEDDLADETG